MDKITYYTPPTDEIFEEIKQAATKVWNTYDNQFGYVDEKVNAIKDIGNIQDNAMYMVAMFDSKNQAKLKAILSDDANDFISDRIRKGQL